MSDTGSSRQIGIWITTALVVGNMIGSGVFLLPASLALYGGISLLGWIGSSVGALCLALVFSYLSKKLRNSSGGPYAFTKSAMGDFPAFFVAWGYWISIWCSNAAIAVAFVSYLSVFIPALATNNVLAVVTGLSAIWLLTWVNSRGIREAGIVQLATTILKIVPLLLIGIVGLFYIDMENFVPFNVSETSDFNAVTASATLTLFAYLGLECATVPSGNVKDPELTIPRATIIGMVITMLIYILGSFVVMGMINPSVLQNSNAPFADAAAIMWGDSARYWVAAGAIVSTFGALNGWILVQAQVSFAASRDKLFPAPFGHQDKKGTPLIAMIISSVLISVLMVMNYTKGLAEAFTFMVLLSTLCSLVPYLFSAASYGITLLQEKWWKQGWISRVFIGILAFCYSLWAVIGSGAETVYWGFVMLMAGLPFYVWLKRKG